MIEINGQQIDPRYYIDKWTKWALEATPATDEQVIKNVQTLYEKAGLKKPKVEVYRNYEKFINKDWDSVRASVGASVRDSVGASVRDSVRDSVRASVRASVGDSVRASVWASVGDSVWASVGDSVGDSVWASVGDSVWASVGAYHWADDMSFADVFVDTNVLSKEKAQELEEYKNLLETQRIGILTEDTAYVLVAPTIRRDNEGRLHSDQRPAVEWEEETGQYYLDGVNLSKKLWLQILSKTMTLGDIMKIENADHRAVALKYNPEVIIKEGKLIHKDGRSNELYLVEENELNKLTDFPKMYFLKMTCPTGRVFIEGIDPEVAEKTPNATDCQAWACGLTLSEYMNMEYES